MENTFVALHIIREILIGIIICWVYDKWIAPEKVEHSKEYNKINMGMWMGVEII